MSGVCLWGHAPSSGRRAFSSAALQPRAPRGSGGGGVAEDLSCCCCERARAGGKDVFSRALPVCLLPASSVHGAIRRRLCYAMPCAHRASSVARLRSTTKTSRAFSRNEEVQDERRRRRRASEKTRAASCRGNTQLTVPSPPSPVPGTIPASGVERGGGGRGRGNRS
ncbi:hypothetical protein BC628DRAFT_1040366 [Trametes gibbosa]|nr:hypothetical protein BC628DRAFT_1040366 [Trametes gibbosa]